jgi:hypothetical protein
MQLPAITALQLIGRKIFVHFNRKSGLKQFRPVFEQPILQGANLLYNHPK